MSNNMNNYHSIMDQKSRTFICSSTISFLFIVSYIIIFTHLAVYIFKIYELINDVRSVNLMGK